MSHNTPRFGRMIPAMVTPFDEALELDLDRAQKLADRLVAGGSDSLIINGTTGESPTVFYPQKMELFRAVVEAVAGRIPVIANVGDNRRRWIHVRRPVLQQTSARGSLPSFLDHRGCS